MKDDFLQHEALDRASVLAEMFETHLAKHAFIKADPELDRQSREISDKLGQLYTLIGGKDG